MPRPQPHLRPRKPHPKSGFYWGTGRRKTACARVRIKPGEGKLIVNKKRCTIFFTQEQDRQAVMAPLAAVKGEKQFDIYAKIEGGGPTGQAGAMALGIARALKNYDEALSCRRFVTADFLTRDGRMKERKKYGQTRCTAEVPVLEALIRKSSTGYLQQPQIVLDFAAVFLSLIHRFTQSY